MAYNYDKTALVEVYAGEAIGANLILCGSGTNSGRISVFKALATDLTKCRGPFFVSDAAISSGVVANVMERKLVTGVDTSSNVVGGPVYLGASGAPTLTMPGPTADDAAFSLIMIVGRILTVHASTGAYLLEPRMLEGKPLMGQVTGGGGSSTLVTGFVGDAADSYEGVPVICMNNKDPVPADQDQIKACHINSIGKLQITFDESNTYGPVSYFVFV
mgnify:CR=1 FL=1